MKMNTHPVRNLYVLAILVAFAFNSCKKDGDPAELPADKQLFASTSAESDAGASTIYDDVFNNVLGVNSEVALGGTGVFEAGRIASPSTESGINGVADEPVTCYVVSFTQLDAQSVFPIKVDIDFGAGCTGKDGIIRKGKISIVYSSRLIFPGATAVTTFDDYYVNGTKVEGTHTITNNSSIDLRQFNVEVADGKLTRPNGNIIQWASSKTITQTEGMLTLLPGDDVFEVTGSSDGSVKIGDQLYEWTADVSSPLIVKFGCSWISKGSIDFKRNNATAAVLDYGSGSCDADATLSVNGQTLEISLR